MASVALTVVTLVDPSTAAVCALTVRVVVQVPPGARAHGFGLDAESVDGNTKLAAVPVSDGIESTKVALVQPLETF